MYDIQSDLDKMFGCNYEEDGPIYSNVESLVLCFYDHIGNTT